jgi:hypothetical protein
MKKGRMSRAISSKETRKLEKRLKKEVLVKANKAVEKAKLLMLAEFDNHPITKEIKSGPRTNNSSGTLGGVGNLFSYIGFNQGQSPTREVRKILESSTRLVGLRKTEKGEVGFQIMIDLPSKEEIAQASPVPWAAARSWVIGIEQGISGLGQYLVKSGGGRSGNGIEVKGTIRQGKFKNTKYVSAILNNLQAHLMNFLKS